MLHPSTGGWNRTIYIRSCYCGHPDALPFATPAYHAAGNCMDNISGLKKIHKLIFCFILAVISAAYRHDYATYVCQHYLRHTYIFLQFLNALCRFHIDRLSRLWMPRCRCLMCTAKTMPGSRLLIFYESSPFNQRINYDPTQTEGHNSKSG